MAKLEGIQGDVIMRLSRPTVARMAAIQSRLRDAKLMKQAAQREWDTFMREQGLDPSTNYYIKDGDVRKFLPSFLR